MSTGMEKFSSVIEMSGQRMGRNVSRGFVLMFCLVTALVVHGWWQQRGLLDTMEQLLELRSKKIALATSMQLASNRRQETLLAQLLTQEQAERELLHKDYLDVTDQFDQLHREFKNLPQDTADRDAMARLAAVVSKTDELTEQALILNSRNEQGQAIRLLRSKVAPLQESQTEVLDGMREHHQGLMNEQARRTREQARDAMWISAALGAGVCLLIGMVFFAVRLTLAERSRSVNEKAREIEALSEKLFEEATHDALTGLANRRMFFQQLEHAFATTKRQSGELALAYIDLDKFKQINDTLGHAAGDVLLTTVAARMQSVVRDVDTLARLGGDEFAIILEQSSEQATAQLEQRLRDTVSQPVQLENESVTPHFSIGFARCPQDADTVQGLLHFADELMYHQKARRRATGSALVPNPA
jgi:diguanylate cyclase (GGDEF)-like protein